MAPQPRELDDTAAAMAIAPGSTLTSLLPMGAAAAAGNGKRPLDDSVGFIGKGCSLRCRVRLRGCCVHAKVKPILLVGCRSILFSVIRLAVRVALQFFVGLLPLTHSPSTATPPRPSMPGSILTLALPTRLCGWHVYWRDVSVSHSVAHL